MIKHNFEFKGEVASGIKINDEWMPGDKLRVMFADGTGVTVHNYMPEYVVVIGKCYGHKTVSAAFDIATTVVSGDGCCDNGEHEYSRRTCQRCNSVYCFSCCASTNVHEGGKHTPSFMTCPVCGWDDCRDYPKAALDELSALIEEWQKHTDGLNLSKKVVWDWNALIELRAAFHNNAPIPDRDYEKLIPGLWEELNNAL